MACAAVIGCYNVMLTNTRAALITLAVCLMLIAVTGLVRLSLRTMAAGLCIAAWRCR